MTESEERFKRIEILLETCAKVTVNNQSEIKELRQQVSQLTTQMASLSDMFVESVGIMKTMQSEIKGVQTENKRILDYLFGENHN